MHKLTKTQAGFSLIQIAIGMIVLGIFIAAAGHSFVIYQKNKEIKTTAKNIEEVRMALHAFRERLGYYPCVAPMDADRDESAYGTATDCTDSHVVPGNCDEGYCVQTAVDGTAYTMTNGLSITPPARVLTSSPRVRIGAIPFRLLQIDEKTTLDGYNSRLLYAVTESLTSPATFSELSGAIHMVNAQGESLVTPAGSAPFVIVSHGPNTLGAYSPYGQQTSPCSGVTLDAQNCFNFNPLSLVTPPTLPMTPPLAVFAADYRADGNTNNSFDDTVEYFSKEGAPKWQRTAGNVEDIKALVEDGVGVGADPGTDALVLQQRVTNYDDDDNPATPEIEHRGALRATDGVRTDEICDEMGNNCFRPELLADDPAAISCANPGKYMVGIANGQAVCDDVRIYCSNNAAPILRKINPDGSPDCVAKPLANCNAPVQLCSGSPLVSNRRNSDQAGITRGINLVGNHGQTALATDTGSYASNQRRATFKCNNGVWTYSSGETGLCSCTQPPAVLNVACAGQSPSGNAATRTGTWNATSCSWSYTSTNYSACQCPGPTTPQPADVTSACTGAAYNSGNTIKKYTFNNASNVCNWVANTTNTCTCDPAVAGTTAGGTRTLTTAVACSTVPGFNSFSGNAYKIQTFKSTGGKCGWEDSGWDTSGCICDTETEHPAPPPASPCSSCEDESTPAVWFYKNIVVGNVCQPGTPQEKTAAVCKNANLLWRRVGGPTSLIPLANPGTRKEINSSCQCVDKNADDLAACYQEAASGGGYLAYNCRCDR